MAGHGFRYFDDADRHDLKPCMDCAGAGGCNHGKANFARVIGLQPRVEQPLTGCHHHYFCRHFTRSRKAQILFALPRSGDKFRQRLKGLTRMSAASLLLDHLDLLMKPDRSLPVLDLACGTGRNGLVLAKQGIPVVFADKSTAALKVLERQLAKEGLPGRVWQVDLEQVGVNPLSGQSYSAILGFRYLHRPLFPPLRSAVKPGGLIIYDTFTIGNQEFGRPYNPDFLLQPGELKSIFQDWEMIHHFEGTLKNPDRAVAQIVARKPAVAG